ncbi:GPW/gp25 family protein [Paraburkholderia sp. J67]|uniref:GPW/gp25 family protein n=1 Tax=Paraburkholderia sp. J67 TaxID=2805435 RepID=UPI002ABE891F|nr:GPW/gp25 family protein [Paraburkholderia sp. J67]
MASADDKAFLGRGWQFPPSFDKAGAGVLMAEAEADIHQSLMVLFSTVPGERVMLPDYGCPLHLHVFDAMDQYNLTLLQSLISDAVLRYEPRILLEEVDFDLSRAMDGLLRITLTYLIRQTNTRSNMVFPFYRSEGTNVRTIA